MAKKIVVTLRKGGSGKTTTAVNLASALAKLGKKTLLVDLDPQANATMCVGINPMIQDVNINTLFTKVDAYVLKSVYRAPFGLHVIPSHPDLADTEAGMLPIQTGILKSILTPLEQFYDFIILDTPPAESYLTVNSLVVADEVIIPLQTHFLALRGLQDVINEIGHVKRGLNPNLKIAGILPTMVNPRTNLSKSVIESVKEKYGELLYPFQVEFSIKHAEASLAGEPIVIYDPTHQGSEAYFQLAKIFIR